MMRIDEGRVRDLSHKVPHVDRATIAAWASDLVSNALPDIPFEVLQTGSTTRRTFVEGSDYDVKAILLGHNLGRGAQSEADMHDILARAKLLICEQAAAQYGGTLVERANKCIKVGEALGGVAVDIIPAFPTREPGLFFWTEEGQLIVDHPNKHVAEISGRDAALDGRLTETVRALKALRPGFGHQAQSYFIERFLLAVPDKILGNEEKVSQRLVRAARYLLQQEQHVLIAAVRGNKQTVITSEEYRESMAMWRELAGAI